MNYQWLVIKVININCLLTQIVLLSTVIQSTATFVAIVAGFIISKLLAISSEKSGLLTRVSDINLQSEIKAKNLDSLEKKLLDLDAEEFIENSDTLDKIVETNGQISLDEALKGDIYCKRSEEELRPYWDEAISITKDAFRILRDNISKLEEEDLDFFLK